MSYKKFLIILLLFTIFMAFGQRNVDSENDLQNNVFSADILNSYGSSDSFVNYDEVEDQLSELRIKLSKPNILKDDIVRGWYLALETEKKYGTPDNWIFIENGYDSKWISPNALDEKELVDNNLLCKGTAGNFVSSCLDSYDSKCEYVSESYCECSYGTKWKVDQGCIYSTEKGTYVAINAEDLEKGWYYGLPNEKKLNTPSSWIWLENGKRSVWQSLK